MNEGVSDVIAARSREPEGLQRMVVISVVVHAAALVLLAFAPAPDFGDDVPRTVMTISLGGAPGPRAGGMTPIAGRARARRRRRPRARGRPPGRRCARAAPAPTPARAARASA